MSKNEACKIEIELIKKYKSNDRRYGYNLSIGGELSALGVIHSNESRMKMSESKKGIKNPNYGKHLSLEHKEKIKLANSGENNYLYGKHLSDETKQKISESRKGQGLGGKNPFAKKVICLTTNEIYNTIREASIKNNCNASHISDCCMGKRLTCGKKKWKYYNEVI